MTTIQIDVSALEIFAAQLLTAGGFTAEEATLTAKSLVLSDLMGHESHGVMRIKQYVDSLKNGSISSGQSLHIEKQSLSTLMADAQRGLGQVQMPRLLDQLLSKANETGTATGTLRNCGHIGRLGEWAERIAQAGLVGFVAVNDNGALQYVAPPGSREALTSTNPLAYGVPLPGGKMFSFDMSTSAAAMGKVRVAYLSGAQIAPGLIQDAQGAPSTDPGIMFPERLGSLLPMGGAQGYKGFGLSMVVDFLAGALSGGFTPPAPENTPIFNNVFVSIWDPEYFAGLDHLQTEAQKYIDHVRSAAPIDPANPVRIPGERAQNEYQTRRENGIPLTDGIASALVKLAERYGVETPDGLSDPALKKSA